MEWLYDLMDVPENLQRGLSAVRPIKGPAAALMAVVLFGLCWLIWPWMYHFDVESTAQWTALALERLAPTLGNTGIPGQSSYAENIGWFVTAMTFLPSILEAFAVRFASARIKAATILVLFFATFDLVTDWPRVSEFIDAFNITIGGGIVALAMKVGLLMLASFGLQALFIVFLVCGFYAAMNAKARPGTRDAAEERRAGMIDV